MEKGTRRSCLFLLRQFFSRLLGIVQVGTPCKKKNIKLEFSSLPVAAPAFVEAMLWPDPSFPRICQVLENVGEKTLFWATLDSKKNSKRYLKNDGKSGNVPTWCSLLQKFIHTLFLLIELELTCCSFSHALWWWWRSLSKDFLDCRHLWSVISGHISMRIDMDNCWKKNNLASSKVRNYQCLLYLDNKN